MINSAFRKKIRGLISTKGYKITSVIHMSDSDMLKASVFSFTGRSIGFAPSVLFPVFC